MLRITGGKVYDPANGIDGRIMDLCIDDTGQFVESVEGGRTIDAAGMIGALANLAARCESG